MPDTLNLPELGNNIPRGGNAFIAWLGRVAMRLLGWRFSGEIPNRKKMLIAIAPHTSNWDFIVGVPALLALRLKLNFFGKDSLFRPPINGFMRWLGGIPVDRSAPQGMVQQISSEIRQADKMILVIAPEGTRSRVERWKTGFLQIAQQADIPVLCMGFDFNSKEYVVGPLINVDEDIQQALQKAQVFYATVQAKFPEKVSYPELSE